MTKTRIYAALILGIFTAAVASEGAGAKSHKKAPPTTGTEGLLYAAGACDLPTLKTIIASGVDVSATDADGYDALSRASINRDDGLRSRTRWKLNCPAAVIALTQAGANPWKARFYQNPRLEENRPEMIAVIRVEDNRENKGKSE
ncbi:MAG: ankyrin repeat domain-containing protein, partial [Terracidiphilus sp.]